MSLATAEAIYVVEGSECHAVGNDLVCGEYRIENIVPNIEEAPRICTVYRDGKVVEYIDLDGEIVKKIYRSTPIELLKKRRDSYIVFEVGGKVSVYVPNLGIVAERGGWVDGFANVVEVNGLLVSRKLLEHRSRLGEMIDMNAVGNDVLGVVKEYALLNPRTLIEMGRRGLVVPPYMIEFGYEDALVEGSKIKGECVGSHITLSRPWLEALSIASYACRFSDEYVGSEFLSTLFHEIYHVISSALGKEYRGAWFLGTPFGEEAEAEHFADEMLKTFTEDDVKRIGRGVRTSFWIDPEELVDLAIGNDRLRKLIDVEPDKFFFTYIDGETYLCVSYPKSAYDVDELRKALGDVARLELDSVRIYLCVEHSK